MTTRYSAALSARLHGELTGHLLRKDGQEDLCFAIWSPSTGETRTTGLLNRAILPIKGDRRVHGNASFLPAYFERAIGEAIAAGGGVAFLHSHGGPGWQEMSIDDVSAERSHAAAVLAATRLPLLGLTLGTDGAWSARFWIKTGPRRYERRWCETVRVVGSQLSVTYHDRLRPRPRFREELRRTISAWGPEAQARLVRLRVGIVGAGSVGSIVGEALARTGFENVTLIDFDGVEQVNLDRLLHATSADAEARRAKVHVLAAGMRRGATAERFEVHALEYSVGEQGGFRAALDCDVLFCCADRPWARSVSNLIAYAHLIPVIDGGIQVGVTPSARLRHADWRAHVASPERRCLECIGQYDPGDVAADREGYFDDPAYIAGLPEHHGAKRNENVFAFALSAAALELLQLLSMVIAPGGVADPGGQMYHFVGGQMEPPVYDACKQTCLYPGYTATGDHVGIEVTAAHPVAEQKRAERLERRRVTVLGRFLDKVRSRAGFAVRAGRTAAKR